MTENIFMWYGWRGRFYLADLTDYLLFALGTRAQLLSEGRHLLGEIVCACTTTKRASVITNYLHIIALTVAVIMGCNYVDNCGWRHHDIAEFAECDTS